MDNKLTTQKDTIPISSIIFFVYLVLNFIFTIATRILNYHENFSGMISNILAALPGLLIASAIILAIAILPLFKVRGPVLAIPFGVMLITGIISTISAAINCFNVYPRVFIYTISLLIILLASSAVSFIAYLLMGIAAIKSTKAAKPILPTIASALFLINTLVAPVTNFISSFIFYATWSGWNDFGFILENSIESALHPNSIIPTLSNLLIEIIFAVGMFFLGRWMAKGKLQVEETVVVEEENAVIE